MPTPAPSPFTRLNTPAGTPASWQNSAKRSEESGASSDGFRTQVQPASSAGITLSVTWFIGQFHGVIRPTTPIGSSAMRSSGAWGPSGRTHSIRSKAARKPSRCQGRQGAWSARAMSMGAPISRLIACAISSARASYWARIPSTTRRRSAGALTDHASNARLAAATAASVSAWSPSEITAQASSVEGSMTAQSRGAAGSTHRPSM